MTENTAAVLLDGIAADLAAVTGLPVTAIFGGFRLRETPTHFIDAVQQIYNWRITTTPKDNPLEYDRYWCYDGTDLIALIRVVLAVAEWDGSEDTEPDGWKKNGQTKEVRHPEGLR